MAGAQVVAGVILSKVDDVVIAKSVTSLGIEVANGASRSDQVKALVAHFKQRSSEEELMDCENCKGVSNNDVDICPYCGEGGEDQPVVANGIASAAAPAPVANGIVQTAPKAPVTKAAPAPKAPKLSAALAKLTAAPAPKAVALSKFTEKSLDEVVHKINECTANIQGDFWKLGTLLLEIHDGQIWKARKDEKGQPAYKSFHEFVRVEVKSYEKRTVYAAIQIRKEFTESQVREFGPSKLKVIAGAAPKDRELLLRDKTKSKNEIQSKVKELNVGRDKTNDGKKKKPTVKPKPNEITIASLVGKKHTVTLMKKAKDKDGEFAPAKRLVDLPWGYLEMENDTRLVFAIKETPAGLKLVVEAKRV